VTDLLLTTKLYIPQTRAALVSRARLFAVLKEGPRSKLTLISAPAGFGKTTLLASFLAGCGETAAWLTLDKEDNQEGRFLRYLAAALQKVDETIGQGALQVLTALQPARPQAILTGLINDIAGSGEDIILVLDDYHVVSSKSVHESLSFLLEHGPQNLHIVLATRSDPPLPLARLRARDQMVELRAADLRFSKEEASAFLNEVMGLKLDDASVTALEERTEGWAAGLQMAALSMRGRENVSGFIENFSGTDRYILDYLLEEVLASQPPEIQQFLLRTSVLERLTGPLCETLLEKDGITRQGEPGSGSSQDAAGILEQLSRDNLFLVPQDTVRQWYRYHPLFADLLRARLHQLFPDLVAPLHKKAAVWLEGHGYFYEAGNHLIAAGETEQAADLVQRYGPKRLMENDPSVLQMAESLPPEAILARPVLGLHQAWQLIIHGRIAKARSMLTAFERQFSQNAAEPCCRWQHTVVTLATMFLSPHTVLDKNAVPGIDLLDEISPEEPILRNAAEYLFVMTKARQGEREEAAKAANLFLEKEQKRTWTTAVPTLAPFLTRIYLMLGRLQNAADLCTVYLDPLIDSDNRLFYASGNLKIDLGEVLLERNRLEEAERYIREGLRANEPWGNIMTEGFGLVALVRVLLAKADFAGAKEAVDRFEVIMSDPLRPHEFDGDLVSMRAGLLLASGDLAAAVDWVDKIVNSGEFDLHRDLYQLTIARIRLEQGQFPEVEELLSGWTPPEPVGSWPRKELESNLLLAAGLVGQGRRQEAFDLLGACIETAEPEGYIRVFLDVGKPVEDLLAAFLRERPDCASSFAQDVMYAFSHEAVKDVPQKDGGLIEPLSERELEVLEIMAQGRTNQEIAQQLVIAPGTVKAHTASIYRKLDVSNRTEAVTRARKLSLIP